MKRFLILLFLFCLFFFARGQGIGQYRFGGGNLGFEAYAIASTSDSGVLILGGSYSSNVPDEDLYLIKISANGDTLWTRVFSSDTTSLNPIDVQETYDGGIIIAASSQSNHSFDNLIIKTNFQGDTLWTKIFDIGAGKIIQTADSGFILEGGILDFWTSGWDETLLKLDKNGSITWMKSYNISQDQFGHQVIQTLDGGYVVSGFISGNPSMLFMMKTDSSGNSLWARKYTTFNSAMTYHGGLGEYVNGNLLVFGYCYDSLGEHSAMLLTTSPNGVPVNMKYFTGTNECWGMDLSRIDDNGFDLLGKRLDSTNGDAFLIRIDSIGDTLWTKCYGSNSYEEPFVMSLQADRSIAIAGRAYGSGPNLEMYMIKTDSIGNSGCLEMHKSFTIGMQTIYSSNLSILDFGLSPAQLSLPISLGRGIAKTDVCALVDIEEQINSSMDEVILYPNVAFSFFKIRNASMSELTIFNIIGEVVLIREINSDEETINCSNLLSGIYFVQVQNKNGTTVQKLIKQ